VKSLLEAVGDLKEAGEEAAEKRFDILYFHQFVSALMFSPAKLSSSDNLIHRFSPSDNKTSELFDPHLFGPCIV
jgi:hypothetical protein